MNPFIAAYTAPRLFTVAGDTIRRASDTVSKRTREFVAEREPAVKKFKEQGKKIPRAVTKNLIDVIEEGASQATGEDVKTAKGLAKAAPALANPLGAAVVGIDLTLRGLDKAFEAAGLPDRQKVEEHQFVKKSKAGKLTEQFLFGDIKYADISVADRKKINAALKSKRGKQFLKDIAGYLGRG